MSANVLFLLCDSPNSYNPLEGPNENPEAELPLTAGEYIYIYGDMDEDGFFEGRTVVGLPCPVSCLYCSWRLLSVQSCCSAHSIHPSFPDSAEGCSEIWDSQQGKEKVTGLEKAIW